ncbi:MAG: DUF3574 domain-containing protein [Pyrinomonadaceae bacterium]
MRKLQVALAMISTFVCVGLVNSKPLLFRYPVNGSLVAAERYYRTELYFGRSISDGRTVTEANWEQFVESEISPRFPDGFTVFDAVGQFRDKNGKTLKEPTKVMIVLYRSRDRKASIVKIDEIRRAYAKQFQQDSVLRVDSRKPADAFF